jgi:hypothetical protein
VTLEPERADFLYPRRANEGIAIGRAGSPLHAESVAPTGVVALPENLATRYFLPARVYAISMVFFSWPPWVSYHSIII